METASSRCHSLRHASVELPYGGAVKPADLHPHHSAEVHFSDELDLPGSGRHPQGDLSVRTETGYSQIPSVLLLLDVKASRAAEGMLLECFMGYVG